MSPTQWKSVKSIFEAALALPACDRAAYLNRECPSASLRAEVESLLASYEDADLFMEAPALDDVPEPLSEHDGLEPGQRLGCYQILQRLDEGGMGSVYQAVRDDAEFRRIVAIKVLKRGMDTAFILRRFHNEKLILAHFDHPNIAKLLDGGMTPDHRPYFVLEFIAGHPIDEYCNEQKKPIEGRLRLFQKVCAAVQYAHQNLVIHRDLKPRNILITLEGEPKLLDFGIAKILEDERDVTQPGAQMLTPGYASPEQMRGEPVTTASDVYSLGVLLYELLTGCKPFSHPSDRLITPTGPNRPSTAVRQSKDSEAEGVRLANCRKWSQRLKGDLDRIILKALHPDPARRYGTVEQFSSDIDRHLTGQPVKAAGDELTYRTRKFLSRHKVSVIAAALVVLSMALGTILATREAAKAREQSRRAQERAQDVRRLANSLIFDLNDVIRTLPGSTPVRAQLMYRATGALASLERDAAGDCYLQQELSLGYERLADIQGDPSEPNLGNLKASESGLRRAIALLEKPPQCNRGTVSSQQRLAALYEKLSTILKEEGNRLAGKEALQKALKFREAILKLQPDEMAARRNLASSHFYTAEAAVEDGDLPAAREARRKAAALYEAIYASKPNEPNAARHVSMISRTLAAVELKLANLPEALRLLRRALEIDEKRAAAKPDDPDPQLDLSFDHSELGEIYWTRREWAAAVQEYASTRALREKLTARDPQNFRLRSRLAFIYSREGLARLNLRQYPEALRRLQAALDLRRQLTSDPANRSAQVEVIESTGHLGAYYCVVGQAQQGRRLISQSLRELQALHARNEVAYPFQENIQIMQKDLDACGAPHR